MSISDVRDAIDIHLRNKYGNDIEIFDLENGQINQIIIRVNSKAENDNLRKFGQKMYYLIKSSTWFMTRRRSSLTESILEDAYTGLELPLPIVDRQKVFYIKRPEESVGLLKFLPGYDAGRLNSFRERQERQRTTYDIVNGSLMETRTVKYKYVERSGSEERTLSEFLYENDRQVLNGNTYSNNTKKPKLKRMPRRFQSRRLKLDLIFKVNFSPNPIVGEVKADSVVMPYALADRSRQLRAYAALLNSREVNYNSDLILYIYPTILSKIESSTIRDLTRSLHIEIVPITLTTDQYLKIDLKRRHKVYDMVHKSLLSGNIFAHEGSVERYNEEIHHLSNLIQILGIT
jgi:hypothetical protein